jgi:geranylgeranyl pyrophosphate synthase
MMKMNTMAAIVGSEVVVVGSEVEAEDFHVVIMETDDMMMMTDGRLGDMMMTEDPAIITDIEVGIGTVAGAAIGTETRAEIEIVIDTVTMMIQGQMIDTVNNTDMNIIVDDYLTIEY